MKRLLKKTEFFLININAMNSPEFAQFASQQMNHIHKLGFNGKLTNSGPIETFYVSKNKFIDLTDDGKLMCYEKALKEYKDKKHENGSIVLDHIYWSDFFMHKTADSLAPDAVKTHISTKDNANEFIEVKIKNGCCSVKSCPFNKYFRILTNEINNFKV